MKKIKEDSSFTSIYTHLWGNVLRVDDAAMAMESRLAECSILLKNHASEIFEWNRIISRTSKSIFYIHKVIVSCMCVCCVCVYLCVYSHKEWNPKVKISNNINLFYFKTSSFLNGPVWLFSWTWPFGFKESVAGTKPKTVLNFELEQR